MGDTPIGDTPEDYPTGIPAQDEVPRHRRLLVSILRRRPFFLRRRKPDQCPPLNLPSHSSALVFLAERASFPKKQKTKTSVTTFQISDSILTCAHLKITRWCRRSIEMESIRSRTPYEIARRISPPFMRHLDVGTSYLATSIGDHHSAYGAPNDAFGATQSNVHPTTCHPAALK